MDGWRARAHAAWVGCLSGPAEIDAALASLDVWMARGGGIEAQLRAMMDEGLWEELADAFCRVLPFGTGGRRGRVGLGPHRINPTTVAASAIGHARYLRRQQPGRRLSVVLAWDVRCFHDRDQRGARSVSHPLLGLSSADLGRVAAAAYLSEGVDVWMPAPDALPTVATPVLSFAVRHLGADGGMNLTASHNPADDNGVKVYDADGVQVAPPDDEQLLAEIAAVPLAEPTRWEGDVEGVRRYGGALLDAYHQAVRSSAPGDVQGVRVVFSPLHGCGDATVGESLRRAGAEVIGVPEESTPDGAFPAVAGGLANPEVPEVLDRAIRLAEDTNALLVLATDPDADRLGVAVRDGERWRALDGNEIAVLVLDALLEARVVSDDDWVVCTEVTTSLLGTMARAAGAQVVDHLPVGFKFIGRLMAERPDARLLLGAEESHGLLVTPEIGDKDAAGGALWLVSHAAKQARRGQGLVDRLRHLEQRFGAVRSCKVSVRLEGASGRAGLARVMRAAREEPPTSVAGMSLVCVRAQDAPDGPLGHLRSATDATARSLITWSFEGARIGLRPSGTEPKLKLYVEARGSDEAERLASAARAWVVERASA
jgi:phosphoglucomutase/phosphomannomutase